MESIFSIIFSEKNIRLTKTIIKARLIEDKVKP